MAAEVHSDLTLIQDEDVLRRMWADTEDFGRKKEIRARMYKLREQRLKDIYTVGDISQVTRKHQTTRHTESIGDQGFLSMKTKEIRDSESPTRDFSQAVITSNTGNGGYWTSRQERSNVTENLDGGGMLKESLDKSAGSGIIRGSHGDTELSLGSENRHTVVSKKDDNSSYHGEAQNSSSQMSSVTKSDTGISRTSKTENHMASKSQEEQVTTDGLSTTKSWSSSQSVSSSSRKVTKSSYSVTSGGQHLEAITSDVSTLKPAELKHSALEDLKWTDTERAADLSTDFHSNSQIRRSEESTSTTNRRQSETVNQEKVVSTSSSQQQSSADFSNEKRNVSHITSDNQTNYNENNSTRDTVLVSKTPKTAETIEVNVAENKLSSENETKNKSTRIERVASETESVTNQKILSEIQKLDSYLSTHAGPSTPASPQSMTDVAKWTIVTKNNTDNEFTYEPRAPNPTPDNPPSSPRSQDRIDKNLSNLELPKEATEGQYVTTYQSHYTRPDRISVDNSPSHDYFASTLRSSPDRQTPSPTKKTGSRGSLDRSSPERKWRQSPRSMSSPSSDRAGPGAQHSKPKEKSPEDRSKPLKSKTPERSAPAKSPTKSPERERRPSSGSYTIERPKSETRRKSEIRTDNKPKRKFSSTQQKQATKARASTPGTSPTRSPERKVKDDSSNSDSDDSHATFKKSKSDVRTTNEKTDTISKTITNLSKEEGSEYYSEESISNELIKTKHDSSPERSAFTPIKNFRTNPESGTFIAGEKRQITTEDQYLRTAEEETTTTAKDTKIPTIQDSKRIPNKQPKRTPAKEGSLIDESVDVATTTTVIEKKSGSTVNDSKDTDSPITDGSPMKKPSSSQDFLLQETSSLKQEEQLINKDFIKKEQEQTNRTSIQQNEYVIETTESIEDVDKRTRKPQSEFDKPTSTSPERKAPLSKTTTQQNQYNITETTESVRDVEKKTRKPQTDKPASTSPERKVSSNRSSIQKNDYVTETTEKRTRKPKSDSDKSPSISPERKVPSSRTSTQRSEYSTIEVTEKKTRKPHSDSDKSPSVSPEREVPSRRTSNQPNEYEVIETTEYIKDADKRTRKPQSGLDKQLSTSPEKKAPATRKSPERKKSSSPARPSYRKPTDSTGFNSPSASPERPRDRQKDHPVQKQPQRESSQSPDKFKPLQRPSKSPERHLESPQRARSPVKHERRTPEKVTSERKPRIPQQTKPAREIPTRIADRPSASRQTPQKAKPSDSPDSGKTVRRSSIPRSETRFTPKNSRDNGDNAVVTKPSPTKGSTPTPQKQTIKSPQKNAHPIRQKSSDTVVKRPETKSAYTPTLTQTRTTVRKTQTQVTKTPEKPKQTVPSITRPANATSPKKSPQATDKKPTTPRSAAPAKSKPQTPNSVVSPSSKIRPPSLVESDKKQVTSTRNQVTSKKTTSATKTYNQLKSRQFIESEAIDVTSDLEDTTPPEYFDVEIDDVDNVIETNVRVDVRQTAMNKNKINTHKIQSHSKSDKIQKKRNTTSDESSSDSEEEGASEPEKREDVKRLQATHDYLNVVVQHPKSSRESSPGYPSERIPLSTTSDDGESNPRYADFVSEPEDVEIFDTLRGPRGAIPLKEPKQHKPEIDEEDISRSSVADKVNVFLEAAKNSLETHESQQPLDIDRSHSVRNAKNMFEQISKSQTTVTSSNKTIDLFEKDQVERAPAKAKPLGSSNPSTTIRPIDETPDKPDDIETPSTKSEAYYEKTEVVEPMFERKEAYETHHRDIYEETNDFKQHEIDEDRTTVRKDTPVPEPLKMTVKPSKKPFVRNVSASNVDINSKRNFFEKKVQEQVKSKTEPNEGFRSPSKKTPEKYNSTKTGSFMKSTLSSSVRTQSPEKQVRAQSPEKRVKAQTPEKTVGAQRPDDKLRAGSPEKKVRGQTPEKLLRGQSPEKLLRERSPEKHARAQSPEKAVRATSPEKVVRAPSPEKPSREQSPEKFVEKRRTSGTTYEAKHYASPTREPGKVSGVERKTSSGTTIKSVEKTYETQSVIPTNDSPLRTTFDEADDMEPHRVVSTKTITTSEETTKTTGKFGVTLRKTPSSTKMVPTVPVTTPKKTSPARENLEIEEIFDLETLELMLIKAVAYEERRRIRSQLRLVKKQLEEEHNKIGTRLTGSTTPVKNKVFTPKEKSPERFTSSTLKSREERNTFDEEERITNGARKSPERKVTSEFRQTTVKTTSSTNQGRETPEKRSAVTKSRESPERRSSKPRVKESPEKIVGQLTRTSPERKVSAPSENQTLAKTDVTTYQATVKTHTIRNVTSEVKDVSTTDSIISSYGVGPTDDNGKPLFGLRALRRTNTNKALTGEVDDEELVVADKEEATSESVTEDILDYSGRPLFGGLKALQSDAMPAQTDQKGIIEKNRQAQRSSVMESTKTVVTSHSSISSDGKVSHRRNVVKGEMMAKNGEQPVGKIVKSTYSYQKDGDKDSTPQVTSKTVTSVIGGRRSSGPHIEEITDGSLNTSCSRRYSKEYTVEEDSSVSNDRRRSSTGIKEDNEIGYTSILKNREAGARKSSLETQETETRTTRLSKDGTPSRTLTRGDSIKALQHKYQQATEAANQHTSRSYPKAGLILRSNSLHGADDQPLLSSSMKQTSTVQTTKSTDMDGAVVTSSQTRTTEDSKTVRTTSGNTVGLSQITSTSQASTTRSEIKSTGPTSFLDNSSKVTGVQDILTRMRNADLVSETGDSTEDAEARALLNKFLGASVILQGMEQGMRAATSQSSTALVNEADKQWVKATTQRSRDDDIDDIYDEKQLQILLDASSDYEERRKIRARLREVMAEKKDNVESAGIIPKSVQSISKTEVHSRTISSPAKLTKANSIQSQSPFAKFKQLERQNSAPSVSRTGSFTFTSSASSIKERLLEWVQAQTREYKNVQIDNFSTSWSNGLAFCALIHHFCPEAFDYYALTPQNQRHNFHLAFTVAEEKADIYPLLDVEDMVMMSRPDWKCVFTYVQSIYRRFHDSPLSNPTNPYL